MEAGEAAEAQHHLLGRVELSLAGDVAASRAQNVLEHEVEIPAHEAGAVEPGVQLHEGGEASTVQHSTV